MYQLIKLEDIKRIKKEKEYKDVLYELISNT